MLTRIKHKRRVRYHSLAQQGILMLDRIEYILRKFIYPYAYDEILWSGVMIILAVVIFWVYTVVLFSA